MPKKKLKETASVHWSWPVPKSWVWVRIGEVADVIGGGTPSTDRYEFWDRGEIPWITPADLSGYKEREISKGARNITQIGLENSSARLLPAGTVLFSSRAPVGYVAIAANPLATNQGFKSFVLSNGILPAFLYYYLQFAHNEITKLASGTTFPEISGKKAMSIPIPIPPTREQERIVAKLDASLARLSEGEAAARRALNRLHRYSAAVLHAAVSGELTHNWRKANKPEETGARLLKRLLDERRDRWEQTELKRLHTTGKPTKNENWKKRYRAPIAPDTSVLRRLPRGWTWASWDQISDWVTYGFTRPMPHVGKGIPIITAKRIRDRRIDYENATLTTRTAYNELSEKDRPQIGDILITKDGTIGRAAIVEDGREFCVNQSVAVVWLRSRLLVRPYLLNVIDSHETQNRIWAKARGIAIKHLSITDFARMPLPLAPLAEQQQIVREIQRRFAAATKLATTLKSQIDRVEVARQSLLREAFAGRLVPQDPKDESASILVTRIRADREVIATKPKAKPMPKAKPKPVETLEQLETLIAELGREATPERVLMAAMLGDDVEKFFDLLRAGRDKGSLVVPVGKGTAIRKARHAN